jgi:hypothetical protein
MGFGEALAWPPDVLAKEAQGLILGPESFRSHRNTRRPITGMTALRAYNGACLRLISARRQGRNGGERAATHTQM